MFCCKTHKKIHNTLTVYIYVRVVINKPINGWFKVSKNVLNLSKSRLYLKISVIKVAVGKGACKEVRRESFNIKNAWCLYQ